MILMILIIIEIGIIHIKILHHLIKEIIVMRD